MHHKNNVTIRISEYFDKWNKIAFSSLSDINTTLKIGNTVTWSFTLHYIIATTSLWCWKKISQNDVISVSIRNRSTSRWKPNKKPMSPQYRVPTGLGQIDLLETMETAKTLESNIRPSSRDYSHRKKTIKSSIVSTRSSK